MLALVLRVVALGRASLWYDEALEWRRAAGSLGLALTGQAGDQDPPLLALFNHFWLGPGRGEAWLRLPEALLGAGTVFVLGVWAWRRYGRGVGLFSALLLAVAPAAIHYSRELNQYAAMIFLGLVSFLALEGVLAAGQARHWRRYGAVSVVGLFTHYGLVFPLGAQALYLLLRARRVPRLRRPLAIHLLLQIAVVLALWPLSLSRQIALSPVQRRWLGTDLAKELAYFVDYGWREVLVFFQFPFSGGPILILAGLLAVVAGLGSVRLWRSGATGRRAVGLGFLAPLLGTYLASIFGLYPFGYRYALFALPFFALALAVGLTRPAGRWAPLGAALGLGTAVAFLAFAPLELWPNPWMSAPHEELRPLLASVERARQPGDMLYIYYSTEPAFGYYDHNDEAAVLRGKPPGPDGMATEARRILDARAGSGRVWLIITRANGHEVEDLESALERAGMHLAERIETPGATAVCFAGRSDGLASP